VEELIKKGLPHEIVTNILSYSDLVEPIKHKTIEEIHHINHNGMDFNFEELVNYHISNHGIYDPQITLNLSECPCKREIEDIFINVLNTPDEDNYHLNILPTFHEKIGLVYPVFPKNGENIPILIEY
jgi:hypothetical protein